MAEQKQHGNFWIYVWLGVSGLLNLSGMASIADGFVTWAKFFRNFIDVYRTTIRQPLAWIGHHIWPFGPIPGWVFDVVVIWAALVLAWNIWMYRGWGTTAFGRIRADFRERDVGGALLGVVTIVILPLCLIAFSFFGTGDRRWVMDILVNFLLLIATFILILFINWQIRQHGG